MSNYDVGGIRHPGWREAEKNPDAYVFDAERREWVRKQPSNAEPQSGYTHCACRDCMDETMSSDTSKPELCAECAEADCEPYRGDGWFGTGRVTSVASWECQREDAYGVDGDPDAEYMTVINGWRVRVSKDGGGTVGREYDGTWTVTVMNGPVFMLDNDEIRTGTPKTHAQVAEIAVDFATESDG